MSRSDCPVALVRGDFFIRLGMELPFGKLFDAQLRIVLAPAVVDREMQQDFSFLEQVIGRTRRGHHVLHMLARRLGHKPVPNIFVPGYKEEL